MTYTVDLDAIMARADAATEGPWALSTGWKPPQWEDDIRYTRIVAGDPNPISGIRKPVLHTDSSLNGSDHCAQQMADAAFAAHARDDIPSLISLVRELQAGIPARVVLDGDPAEIEAALDALPDRAVVTSESLASFDMFLKEPLATMPRSAWFRAGFSAPIDSDFLARNYSPLVVLR